ncbi:MAG: (d)CMP kinase [Chloroflexota bacterium]
MKTVKGIPSVITIDGPAASGKTTVGYEVANYLSYLFLDTGCMYRAVTWAAIQRSVDPNDAVAISRLAETLDLKISPPTADEPDLQYLVHVDGQDITQALRMPEVDANVSAVSAVAGVREAMVAAQRKIGFDGQVVMVGRDIGTVVMPDAPLKLYMTASAEERARRRLTDRTEQGVESTYEEILADINRRDEIDSSREHSPLRPADDAIIVDTSEMDQQAAVCLVVDLIKQMERP